MDKLRVPNLHPFDVAAYVSRPALERRIIDHISTSRPKQYLIVVGSRGVGKSFLVCKLMKERRKIAYVRLKSKEADLEEALRSKLEINPTQAFEIEDLFEPFEKLRVSELPVLVVEIDGTIEAEAVVSSQSQVIKSLCDNFGLAHGVLILSNANAAAWLKEDGTGQDFF